MRASAVPTCSSKFLRECSFHVRVRSLDRHLAQKAGTALGDRFEGGAKRGREEPKQGYEETSGDQRDWQEVGPKEGVGHSKTGNKHEKPQGGKCHPASRSLLSQRVE